MEVHLDGYRFLRCLRSSSSSQVWSAERTDDHRSVVAKVFPIEDRAGLEARVEHEFELIRRLEVPGVVRALALERSGRNLVLVLEAHEGVDLAEHLAGRPIAIDAFFELALQLVAILAEVHDQRVIHRDIKPSNILITPATGVVALADFGISVLMESERGRIHEREVVEGTLPYMAPEQTGRTSRAVDFRSDLYALGVTFYELLTGRRPFEFRTPLELIHAQLAQRPKPPQALRPELPTLLSGLIVKLLEKAPERRYQSARGLHADLLALHDGLRGGAALEQFKLGRGDVSTSLQLPHQLYGREREAERLRAMFREVARGGSALAVIVGPAGVGKTALLDVLVEPVIERRGFLVRGKFELDSDQPFSGIVAALSALADQLLTESSERLARWRAELRERLAGFAPVIASLVPRFVAVLGEVGPSRELGPTEARNQVMLACARLLAQFARPAHPLVLALDDLQWADAGSLELLASVLGEPGTAMLVVATVREDALARAGGLTDLLERVRVRGLTPVELRLGPLELASLRALVGDALSRSPEEVGPVVEIIARKTGSNPFFARQFLLHLVELGLLERGARGWVWDAAKLEAAVLPEDVLDMMARKLERLDESLRELIGIASVFGSEFDPLAVERVAGGPTSTGSLHSGSSVGGKLHALVDEGLIAPLAGRGYVFGHDRIREAAYALLGESRRRALHRAVGDDLLARLDAGERGRRVFEIVDHLDRGYDLHADELASEVPESRRIELAELNLEAGQRALLTGAPQAARAWLTITERLLEGSPIDHPLRFPAVLGLAQAEALSGDPARADARLVAVLAQETRPSERGRAAAERVRVLLTTGDADAAIQSSIEVLRQLGVAIPVRIGLFETLRAVARITRLARPAAVERWRTSAPMTDPRALAACEVLTAINTAAFVMRPELFVVSTERFADLIVRYGDHPVAPQVFGQLGLVMANGFGRRREAVELAALCVELGERHGSNPLIYRAQQTLHYLRFWFEPIHTLVEPAQRIFEIAQEVGDLHQANFLNSIRNVVGFYAGVHLRIVAAQAEARAAWTTQWGTKALAGAVEVLAAVCQSLTAGPAPALDDPDPFGVGRYTADGFDQINVWDGKVAAGVARAIHGQWAQVARGFEGLFATFERAMPGSWYQVPVLVLEGIAVAVVEREAPASERRRLRRRLRRNADQLSKWVGKGGNFGHAEALLRAELAALEGKLVEALRHYRKACQQAAEQRNPWFEALASERLATLLLEHDEALAFGPLRQARERYLRWGAFAKVAALEQRWPSLIEVSKPESASTTGASSPTSSSTTSQVLDTASLVKTSAAIADDLRLEQVVDRIMAIAIENAGAARGVLILADADELRIVAEVSAEHGSRSSIAGPRLLDDVDNVPATVLRWVERTRETLLLADARVDPRFAADPYLRSLAGGSLMCLPIVKQRGLVGLLYLENDLSAGAFTFERLELLRLLTSQAASALDNARLYADLRTSEIRWRSLVEQLPDVVVLVDRRGVIDFVNTEIPNAEGGPLALVGASHRASIQAALDQVFAGAGQQQLEIEWLAADGTVPWFAVRLAPIVVDGRIDRAIVVATDISERKRAEVERARLEFQLRQQQRLESIGTLASGVAHEINNPIQGIMNYAELIAGSPVADDDIREFAGEIDHETKRVSSIVRNLLAFSRQEQVRFESGSIAAIVEGTVSLIQAVLRKDQIHLVIDIPPDLPELCCRPQQIQQVVMNLVTNARDALNLAYPGYHPDKQITIDAATFEREGAPWLSLRVADRGGGVPEQVLAQIFDPFFTTKGRDQGTGLGLSVSHGIVSDHGGVLRLANHVGQGACFAIELPVSQNR